MTLSTITNHFTKHWDVHVGAVAGTAMTPVWGIVEGFIVGVSVFIASSLLKKAFPSLFGK